MASVSTSKEGPSGAVSCCGECGAPLADDQRYCVECGARRGPLAPPVATLIGVGEGEGGDAAAELAEPRDALARQGARGAPWLGSLSELSPSLTAVVVLALLACGVLIGSAVSPAGQSTAEAPLILAVSPSTTGSSPTASATTPPPSSEAATPAQAGSAATTPATTGKAATPSAPAKSTHPSEPSSGPTTPALPPITHVFLIVLSDEGYNAAFGPSSRAPYLSKTLPGQGELIEDYYAVTSGELANEVALISGQGPTPQTAANCPLFTDITPGTIGAQGQVEGSGCVYARPALTLAAQLTSAGLGWKAYVEGIGDGGAGQPTTCRHPTLGEADPDQAPTPQDPYVTWRDPFVYFHSVIDETTCASSVVGMEQLAPDLKAAPKTPSLAYIIPDRCHDGSAEPCAPGQPAGLAGAEVFLRKVVPAIEGSPAYKAGGLIAITFDQAPQSGPEADTSGCCTTSAYPNLPTGATGATDVTSASGVTGPPGVAGPSGTGEVGGGKVGLLLLSKYVKPATINVTGQYNHFSLLASIENLFGASHLGYAGSEGVLAFDTSVYNAHR